MLCTDLPPERQRLVFAGQILAAPDDLLSDVRVRERRAARFVRFARLTVWFATLAQGFGEGSCVLCQEIAAARP
jgi:hypothetical protein